MPSANGWSELYVVNAWTISSRSVRRICDELFVNGSVIYNTGRLIDPSARVFPTRELSLRLLPSTMISRAEPRVSYPKRFSTVCITSTDGTTWHDIRSDLLRRTPVSLLMIVMSLSDSAAMSWSDRSVALR
jgi:hypothetical protein